MTIEALLQSFLVHVVSNETNTSAEHEQAIDSADIDILLGLLTEMSQGIISEHFSFKIN